MKCILLFGAGKSSAYLIHFLESLAIKEDYRILVADYEMESILQKCRDNSPIEAFQIDITNEDAREKLISQSNVVISLMPPDLHYLLALSCLRLKKHLLTASYLDERTQLLSTQVKEAGICFLYEMGLDPGIDHMSAMRMINNIQAKGGIIKSFQSHCGGLIAPESDNNPWHYKISWNPKNIVNAGKDGALYLAENIINEVSYQNIFSNFKTIIVPKVGKLECYANRDSLSYLYKYNLENSCHTFIRTTLRYPNFCIGWQNLVELGLTERTVAYETANQTIETFINTVIEQTNKSKILATFISDSIFKNQYEYLFKQNETRFKTDKCTPADCLQLALEKRLPLGSGDKDLVVMHHEITYSVGKNVFASDASLVLKGVSDTMTAMAKTVGLPLGIAAELITKNKLNLEGLFIPTIQAIYVPVLERLAEMDIYFEEEEFQLL